MKNMKIMIDTNIFMDVMLNRESLADTSAEVLTLCESRKFEGVVSASCVTDIFYIVRKHLHSTELAYQAVGKVLDIVKICPVTNQEILKAYEIHAQDFEDCLLAMCANANQCDCIITRNTKDFPDLGISVITPEEFLQNR